VRISNFSDLAYNRAKLEVKLSKLRPVDSENMQLLPQRVKSCSVSGFALRTSSVWNHARSAFKRFSHPPPFAFLARENVKDWSENISQCSFLPKELPLSFHSQYNSG